MIHEQWIKSGENEFGQLFQGCDNDKVVYVLQLIHNSEITQG